MIEGATSAAPVPTSVDSVETDQPTARINKMYRGTTKGSPIILQRDWESGGNSETSLETQVELVHSVDATAGEAHRALRSETEICGFESQDLDVALEPGRFLVRGERETTEEPHRRKTMYPKHNSDQSCRVIPWLAQGNGAARLNHTDRRILESLQSALKCHQPRSK